MAVAAMPGETTVGTTSARTCCWSCGRILIPWSLLKSLKIATRSSETLSNDACSDRQNNTTSLIRTNMSSITRFSSSTYTGAVTVFLISLAVTATRIAERFLLITLSSKNIWRQVTIVTAFISKKVWRTFVNGYIASIYHMLAIFINSFFNINLNK